MITETTVHRNNKGNALRGTAMKVTRIEILQMQNLITVRHLPREYDRKTSVEGGRGSSGEFLLAPVFGGIAGSL